MSNQSIYLKHFQLHCDPFRQEPDPETFFSGAGREEMLLRLQDDIESGKPLIKLTGSDGVGKTLLYLMLAQKLSSETFDLVCLDHPVGSFEDLLRIICHALRRNPSNETVVQQSYLPEFKEHLKERGASQRKVILIIDEAEKLFLATLERLVRLICDTDEGNVLHILLIGRPDLEKNIDQLVIYCSNVDVNARYILEPLTLSETEQYLQYRLQAAGAQADKALAILDTDAAAFIYQGAMGNISLTNMLAEKGLKMACDAGMFKVSGELLNPQQPKTSGVVGRLMQAVEQLGRYKLRLLSAAAAVLVLALMVTLWPEGGQETPADLADSRIEQPGETPVVDIGIIDPVEPAVSQESVSVREEQILTVEPKEEEAVEEAVVEQLDSSETAVVSPGDIDMTEEARRVVLQPEARKRKGPEPVSDYEPMAVETGRDPDELFRERLRASSSWLAWAYRGGYTIQLMVLASEEAEESLKSLLVQDDYYGVRENLYILRKSQSPTLLVFYGFYDSLEEARLVRDALPQFLHRNQPYALSIDEALKKTEK